MYPEKMKYLKKWAKMPGRWMKRASAVSLIVPARKGIFLKEILSLLTYLLTDSDDMVQKGYGWMLKGCEPGLSDGGIRLCHKKQGSDAPNLFKICYRKNAKRPEGNCNVKIVSGLLTLH